VFEEPEFEVPRRRPLTVGRIVKTIVIPLAVAALLAVFVWNDRDRLDELWNAPVHWIAAIAALVLIGHFLNSTEFWLLYRTNGCRSGLFENWMLFLASQLGNYVPAQAGTLYRLRYMRAVHDMSYPESAAVYSANFVATLVGASVTAFIGVIGFALAGGRLSYTLLLISAGLIALAIAMAVVPLPQFAARNGRLARAWRSFHSGFEQIRRDPGIAFACVLIEIAKYVVTGVRMYIAFRLLDVDVPFWAFLVLAPAAGIAGFISFTPGAFGFRELFITGSAAALGIGVDNGLLGATIDRAVMLATSLVFGSLAFLYTYPRLRAATTAQSTRTASTT
jgi:uncharacterized membrane protein YbhN (UPF0104 family)